MISRQGVAHDSAHSAVGQQRYECVAVDSRAAHGYEQGSGHHLAGVAHYRCDFGILGAYKLQYLDSVEKLKKSFHFEERDMVRVEGCREDHDYSRSWSVTGVPRPERVPGGGFCEAT